MSGFSWEKQYNESKEAFEAFALYRDLGIERSMRLVSERLAKSESLMKRWSARHSWRDRAAAFDKWQDTETVRAQQVERVKQIEEMRDRHSKVATMAQNVVVRKLSQIAQMKDDEIQKWKITPRDLMYWLVEAVKMERQARGEAGEVVAVISPEEMHRQNITRARNALEESFRLFHDIPLKVRVETACGAFGVEPEELGYDPKVLKEDAEEVQTIG
jgi:hypothetical protein